MPRPWFRLLPEPTIIWALASRGAATGETKTARASVHERSEDPSRALTLIIILLVRSPEKVRATENRLSCGLIQEVSVGLRGLRALLILAVIVAAAAFAASIVGCAHYASPGPGFVAGAHLR